MSYSIVDCFMAAFVCGCLFGFVYEAFRIIRRAFKVITVTFICDVCFFIMAGFFVFNLSLYLGNYVRIYTILGFGTGVFAYIQTIGRIMTLIENILGKIWGATIGAFINSIVRFFKRVIGAFAHKIGRQFGRINDFFQKAKKNAPKLLQFEHKKLYNNSNVSMERSEKKYVIQAKVRRGS